MKKLLRSMALGIQLALAGAASSLLPTEALAAITYEGVGAAAHANGGAVTPGLPSGHTTSDLLVIIDALRNSSETVSATDYVELLTAQTRATILAKVHDGTEADPTVTPTGAPNAHSAVMIGLAGTTNDLSPTSDIVHASASASSGTADNTIEYPALTVSEANTVVLLIALYNNDDDGSGQTFDTPSGFTQVGAYLTGLGADQTIVVYYSIQTTAANISSGTITRTAAGTTAVSGAVLISLRAAAVAPTLSSVSVTGRTSSSVTVSYTSDQAGTAYTARANIDQTAPTCDELEANTYAQAVSYATEATAGGADSIAHTGLTNGTARDFYICVENSGGTDSAVTLIQDVYKIPDWTSAPVVSAQGTGDYTIAKDLDGAGSTYAVACLKDSTAPTYAQVAAGNCTGDAAAIAAATGDGTSATLALGSSLTRPIHDIYVVGTYGSQESAVTTLADEMLDAPAGYQYDLLASVSATSPCKELNDIPISPTIAAADVIKTTTTVAPGGEALTTGTDCEMQYTDPNGTRRTTTLDVYDTTAGDWMTGGPTTIYFNNSVPTCLLSNCQYDSGETLINGVAMTSVDTALWFDDEEDDTLTITYSGDIPASTTIVDGLWSGTPSCASGNTSGLFTVTATDVANDTETVDATWVCYDQVEVPNCTSPPVTMSACGASLEALNLNPGATLVYDAGTAVGFVKSLSPAAGTSVNPFTTVSMTVSLGIGASGRRRTLGIGIGVGRFTPEIPLDGIFDDQFFLKFKWRF